MSDDNMALTPSYLDNLSAALGALDQYDDLPDSFQPSDADRTRFARIDVPQPASRRFTSMVGNFLLTDGNERFEAVERLDLLLIDALVIDNGTIPPMLRGTPNLNRFLPAGARTMWAYNTDGTRNTEGDAPVCGSPNGIEPWRSNLEKTVFDFRTNRNERIGYRLNPQTGQYERLDHACIGCPFAEWMQVDGKSQAPLCQQTFVFVVWDVDRKEMFVIRGSNRGMQLALQGYKGNSKGRRWDGEVFPGLRHYFEPVGKTEDGTVLYRNRPEGRPTASKPDRPIIPVRATLTLNNFGNATIVPQFTLLDGETDEVMAYGDAKMSKQPTAADQVRRKIKTPRRVLNTEELLAYTIALNSYVTSDMRNTMMGLNNLRPHIEVTPPTNPELPSGKNADDSDTPFPFDSVTEGDIVDGDI